ncbi:MAG: aminomethyl transferase family protein, partial [Deltaproteobacteria bacterium]
YKYDVHGPDAGAFLGRIWTRDIESIKVGRVVYSAMCDPKGWCLDDGTVARLGPDHYRCTSSEPWRFWLDRHSRGFDVRIEDTTDRIAALALQGPRAAAVLRDIVEWDITRMRFFRVRHTRLAGVPVWISRTGYTGDLGYEIWMDPDVALTVWDAIVDAGAVHGLEPAGLDALDVCRVEAGFILQGVDYVSARNCLIDRRKSTPDEAGLGWTVDLDRDPFIGQDAILAERRRGPRWGLVGLELDQAALEALYDSYGLPPHLAPCASRLAVPVYSLAGHQVGQVTSQTWSPLLKRYLGLGQVRRPFDAIGTELMVEHTVEFERRRVPARVVERPCFDPPRKRARPAVPPTPITQDSR